MERARRAHSANEEASAPLMPQMYRAVLARSARRSATHQKETTTRRVRNDSHDQKDQEERSRNKNTTYRDRDRLRRHDDTATRDDRQLKPRSTILDTREAFGIRRRATRRSVSDAVDTWSNDRHPTLRPRGARRAKNHRRDSTAPCPRLAAHCISPPPRHRSRRAPLQIHARRSVSDVAQPGDRHPTLRTTPVRCLTSSCHDTPPTNDDMVNSRRACKRMLGARQPTYRTKGMACPACPFLPRGCVPSRHGMLGARHPTYRTVGMACPACPFLP